MDDPTALFKQYEQEYCNKSTEISRKISGLTAVTTGGAGTSGTGKFSPGDLLSPLHRLRHRCAAKQSDGD